MRSRGDRNIGSRLPRALGLGLVLGVLVVGCASTPATDRPSAASPPATSDGDSALREARERSRRDLAVISADETSLTITERLRISGEARANYELAMQNLAQERYDEGIALLLAVIADAPDVTAPHIDLGIAYGRAGDLEAAEAALQDALTLTPNHPVANNELGIIYRRTGRFDAARASYEQALAVLPAFHYARRNLAVLCDLYLADLPCALANYEAYLQSVGEDDEVSIWVADIRARVNR
ncbi:MAG TPA: tetratricopeptide repeat protein [Gammaproteobacteria bacterium]|nr:tetratricopeptide repeat protein [Gammaproteobacteria bacterium]